MQTILPGTAISQWLTRCRGRTDAPPARRSYDLPGRQILAIRFPAGGKILCQRGRLWITCDGRREDIVLTAGKGHEFSCGGRWVVETLESSVFEIVRC